MNHRTLRNFPAAPGMGAVELATKLSIAVRIEPELLRAMRLGVLPYLDVSAEPDLWFSRWVHTRGADGIVLLPNIRSYLQRRLAAQLATQAADERERIWDVVASVHESISPALLLEERVAWLVAQYGADASDAVDMELRSALRALAEGRTGLATWFGRAWARLPEMARATPAAWQLAQVSASHLQGGPLPVATVPRGLAFNHLTEIADLVRNVRFGVRRDGWDLGVGEFGGAGTDAVAILVPDTDPRLVEWRPISGVDSAYQTIAIPAGTSAQIRVGMGAVLIRTAQGLIYEIPPSTTIELRLDHQSAVNAVVFSPDGSRVATGSDDGSARVSGTP